VTVSASVSDTDPGVAVLCGGVGAARFLDGLVRVVAPENVTAIVNVGDDAAFHGLHVSPDIDTILYTLAGLVDETRGWGIRGDTAQVQDALSRLGAATWFHLSDADLATHLFRTARLRGGSTLSQVTDELRSALGLRLRVLPSTDDPSPTTVLTDAGWLAFQEYFVHRGARDRVREVRLPGGEPAPGVLDAIANAKIVVVAPSNPIVSIGPILAVRGAREALHATAAVVVAISPIVGGRAIKGPAADMLAALGHEVSPVGIAEMYRDFLDILVLDEADAAHTSRVASLGVRAVVVDTIMRDAAAREALARRALEAAGERDAA
jgi:LPPG:FO 2-phospho-L-lactate transferase